MQRPNRHPKPAQTTSKQLGYMLDGGEFQPIDLAVKDDRAKPRFRPTFGVDFVYMFQPALLGSSADRDLKIGNDGRVLMYLLGTLAMKNGWAVFNQADIARQTGVPRPKVNRAIQAFVAKGILLKGDRIGRGFAFSLNAQYAWRGSIDDHKTAKKTAPPLRLLRGGRNDTDDDDKERAMIEASAPLLPGIGY